MRKFNKKYKQLIFQQKYFLWKQKNSIISQDIIDWIGDNIIKPIGDTVEGVGDTFTSLGKGDLKGVGKGLVKTIASPVKLAVNAAKAPLDVIEAGAKLCQGDKIPDKIKQAAEKLSDDDVKKARSQNPSFNEIIKKRKLDMEHARWLLASTGTIVVVKRGVQIAKKKANNKAGDKNAEVKLTQQQQKMLEILAEARGVDVQKIKPLFMKYLAKGRIVIFNGKKKKMTAVSKKKFETASNKYIKFAEKVNLNKMEDTDTAINDYSNDDQVKEYIKVAIPVIAKLLKKDPKLITKRMNRRIKRGLIYVIKNGKPKTIKIEKFKENFDTYIQAVEDDSETTKAEASSKQKAAFKAAAQKLQNDLPATKLAKATKGIGYNRLKPPAGINMYNIDGKITATWDHNEELDNNKNIEAWRNFLNTGWKDDKGTAHPRAIANALSQTLASGDRKGVNWIKMDNCKELYQTWIDEANAVADKFKKFDIDIK